MTTIDVASVPRLARGVRLRRDRITGRLFLLRPERGFQLLGSAGEVLKLCEAKLTVAQIAHRLAAAHGETARAMVIEDVTRLLAELASRGLIDVGDAR